MEKKYQKQTKQQKKQKQSSDMRFGVIVEDEVFPFSMTTEQLNNYQLLSKKTKQPKRRKI